MKKTTKMMVILTLCGVVLAGCSGGSKKDDQKSKESKVKVESTGFPIVKEELSMTMMAPGTGLAEWKDMPTLQEYEK